MAEALKEMFNKDYYQSLANKIEKTEKKFDKSGFIKSALQGLEAHSLNERMRRTSALLHQYLPGNYQRHLEVFKEVIRQLPAGYTNLVFPDYVAQFGLQEVKASLDALKVFTAYGSSEFAIRVFLKNHFDTSIRALYKWSEDENHHVRRLASEGSRPRLPWSFKLDRMIEDPTIAQPILENLKEDAELYVRKSVANHLNDVSKDNPEYLIKLLKSWKSDHPHTKWIIKHASRSLIKKGNTDSLSIFEFEKNPKISLENLKLNSKKIKLGETLHFEFDIISKKSASQKLVVDYLIHYRKKSGEWSPKVFKLKEVELKGTEKLMISKKQVMKDFSTRKHYEGLHKLEIQVNGKVLGEKEFVLVK